MSDQSRSVESRCINEKIGKSFEGYYPHPEFRLASLKVKAKT
jgi:hypothetical protein